MSSAAIYQAGRAVIGRILGQPRGLVTVSPDFNNGLGYAEVNDPIHNWKRGDGSRRTLVEASCVSLYAGREAELIIKGKQEVLDTPDCSKATSLIMLVGVRGAVFVGDDIWKNYENRLRQRAGELVS